MFRRSFMSSLVALFVWPFSRCLANVPQAVPQIPDLVAELMYHLDIMVDNILSVPRDDIPELSVVSVSKESAIIEIQQSGAPYKTSIFVRQQGDVYYVAINRQNSEFEHKCTLIELLSLVEMLVRTMAKLQSLKHQKLFN